MARRLFAVIVAALLMGVIFGGLRVADAESSAAQFSRVSQLANLGQKLTVLVNALQNERDETLAQLDAAQATWEPAIRPLYEQTGTAATAVQAAISGLGSGLPSNIQNDVTSVLADIAGIGSVNPTDPANAGKLHGTLGPPQDDLAVISNYDGDINDMIALADQVGQGVSDASLASDVRALNALALAKDQASEQRAPAQLRLRQPDRITSPTDLHQEPITPYIGGTVHWLTLVNKSATSWTPSRRSSIAYGQELADEPAFQQAATPAEAAYFTEQTACGAAAWPRASRWTSSRTSSPMPTATTSLAAATDTGVNVPGSQLVPSVQTRSIRPCRRQRCTTNPATSSGVLGYQLPTRPGIQKLSGLNAFTTLAQGQAAWDTGMGDELNAMQSTERSSRATSPPGPASSSRPPSRPRSPTASSPWWCCSSSCWPRSWWPGRWCCRCAGCGRAR